MRNNNILRLTSPSPTPKGIKNIYKEDNVNVLRVPLIWLTSMLHATKEDNVNILMRLPLIWLTSMLHTT
jgi:hypothetical protein